MQGIVLEDLKNSSSWHEVSESLQSSELTYSVQAGRCIYEEHRDRVYSDTGLIFSETMTLNCCLLDKIIVQLTKENVHVRYLFSAIVTIQNMEH